MEELINKYLILEKQEDLRFEGNHPNGINKGYKLKGWCVHKPIIGEQLFLYISKSIKTSPSSWTSRLVNIDMENMMLETKNSKYKISIDEGIEDLTLDSLKRSQIG